MSHSTIHVIHFQVMMFNHQFSQMSLSRNNDWLLYINWYVCSSDTIDHQRELDHLGPETDPVCTANWFFVTLGLVFYM